MKRSGASLDGNDGQQGKRQLVESPQGQNGRRKGKTGVPAGPAMRTIAPAARSKQTAPTE
jgi:hypothetical protein